MMKKNVSIDWNKLCRDYDEWLCKLADNKPCESCGIREDCFPDWDEQKDKIQELGDAQVREIVVKKI